MAAKNPRMAPQLQKYHPVGSPFLASGTLPPHHPNIPANLSKTLLCITASQAVHPPVARGQFEGCPEGPTTRRGGASHYGRSGSISAPIVAALDSSRPAGQHAFHRAVANKRGLRQSGNFPTGFRDGRRPIDTPVPPVICEDTASSHSGNGSRCRSGYPEWPLLPGLPHGRVFP